MTCSVDINCRIVDIRANGFSIQFEAQKTVANGMASLSKATLDIRSRDKKTGLLEYPYKQQISLLSETTQDL